MIVMATVYLVVVVVVQVTSFLVWGLVSMVLGRALLVITAGGRAHRATCRCKAIPTRFGRICRRHFPMVCDLIRAA